MILPRSGAVMCPACLRGHLTAGHDVIRRSAPNHSRDLDGRDPRMVLPFFGLTGRHHAFIALATCCLLVLSGNSRRFSVNITLGKNCPGHPCHLVGQGYGNLPY